MNMDAEEVPIPPELQAEFDEWERMSNETMARLDAEEDLGWYDVSTSDSRNAPAG